MVLHQRTSCHTFCIGPWVVQSGRLGGSRNGACSRSWGKSTQSLLCWLCQFSPCRVSLLWATERHTVRGRHRMGNSAGGWSIPGGRLTYFWHEKEFRVALQQEVLRPHKDGDVDWVVLFGIGAVLLVRARDPPSVVIHRANDFTITWWANPVLVHSILRTLGAIGARKAAGRESVWSEDRKSPESYDSSQNGNRIITFYDIPLFFKSMFVQLSH